MITIELDDKNVRTIKDCVFGSNSLYSMVKQGTNTPCEVRIRFLTKENISGLVAMYICEDILSLTRQGYNVHLHAA